MATYQHHVAAELQRLQTQEDFAWEMWREVRELLTRFEDVPVEVIEEIRDNVPSHRKRTDREVFVKEAQFWWQEIRKITAERQRVLGVHSQSPAIAIQQNFNNEPSGPQKVYKGLELKWPPPEREDVIEGRYVERHSQDDE